MSIDAIIVTFAGILAIAGVAWFFWGPRGTGVHAQATSSGRQEATIVVKGAYTPDVVVVQHGVPIRLNFLRQETAACSEEVLFPDFGRRVRLPEGELVTLDLDPAATGEYQFTCGMGMLRGRLVVE
jgi:plastocyanin domain-containing protein